MCNSCFSFLSGRLKGKSRKRHVSASIIFLLLLLACPCMTLACLKRNKEDKNHLEFGQFELQNLFFLINVLCSNKKNSDHFIILWSFKD